MIVYFENIKTEACCQGAAKSRGTLTYPLKAAMTKALPEYLEHFGS